MEYPGCLRPDSSAVTFATSDVGAGDKLEYWNGITARYFGPMETRTTARTSFSATLDTRPVSFLRTYHIIGSSHRVWRTRSNSGAVPDAVKLLLQVRGCCRIEQAGRTAELRPGAWCVYDTWRPYGLNNPGDVEQIVIQIPRDQIFDRSFPNLPAPCLADPDRSSMAHVAASFIRAYVGPGLASADGDQFLAETTIGFVRHMLHSEMSLRRCKQTGGNLLRTRIRQYILAHLSDPDLSIDQIASAMGCSKRHLHQAFVSENITIERYIWRVRIDQCREALADQEQLEKSITTIAFERGFNSSAHFSRLFKLQVGVAPTAFRRSC
jgi:AraC-like DNA-binding protein